MHFRTVVPIGVTGTSQFQRSRFADSCSCPTSGNSIGNQRCEDPFTQNFDPLTCQLQRPLSHIEPGELLFEGLDDAVLFGERGTGTLTRLSDAPEIPACPADVLT